MLSNVDQMSRHEGSRIRCRDSCCCEHMSWYVLIVPDCKTIAYRHKIEKQIGTWNLFNSIVQLQNYIKQFYLTSDFGPSGVYFRNTSSVNRWSLPFGVLAFVDLTRKEFIQPKDKLFSIRSPESKIIKPCCWGLIPIKQQDWKNTKSLHCALTFKSNSSKWFRSWAWLKQKANDRIPVLPIVRNLLRLIHGTCVAARNSTTILCRAGTSCNGFHLGLLGEKITH